LPITCLCDRLTPKSRGREFRTVSPVWRAGRFRDWGASESMTGTGLPYILSDPL
jgi:hypothetical protein